MEIPIFGGSSLCRCWTRSPHGLTHLRVISVVCNRCFSSSQLPDTEEEMERIYKEICVRHGQDGANEMAL